MKLIKPYAAAICAASATSRPRPPLYTSVITNGFLYDLIILTLVQKSTSIKNIIICFLLNLYFLVKNITKININKIMTIGKKTVLNIISPFY